MNLHWPRKIGNFAYGYKILNNHTFIDVSARPTIAGTGITRSQSNDNLIKFIIPFAKTVTFQTSYFIRSCKACNVLSNELRHSNISFYAFKCGLKSYYKRALLMTYNYDEPREWKTVCIKCRKARPLDNFLTCF